MARTTVLKRYRGDTYPIEATLTRDGDWTLTGSTITMTFDFSGTTYSFTGTITSETDKTVSFDPTVVSVDTVRRGTFDIQVDDGVYIATHIKGVIDIIDDVTP